jgi:DNA-binding CsgD family transcriptional regulator
MSDAAISGEPVILLTPAEADEEYPAAAKEAIPVHAPVACWPLALPQQSLGALQLTLPSSPAAQTLLADGAEVAVLLSLYLSLAGPLPPRPLQPALVSGDPVNEAVTGSDRSPDELTERQSAILVRMAAGQTNAQIARDIGFSESTVRQETMAIYRCLGATGRHDATRLAAERGMTLGN